MRVTILGAVALFAAVGAAPAEAEEASADSFAAVNACIDSHAKDVERVVEDIREGVFFLVGSICADALNAGVKDMLFRSVMGDASYDWGDEVQRPNMAEIDQSFYIYTTVSPEPLSRASKKLLDLRIARLDGEVKGTD